jgi:LysM repeat protein
LLFAGVALCSSPAMARDIEPRHERDADVAARNDAAPKRAAKSEAEPAAAEGDADADAGDEHGAAPVSEIPEKTRAPAHADCDMRVPLWQHVVAEGEHLGGIAGRYGVRRADLLRLNPDLKNPDLIRVGQSLRVCPTIAPRIRKTIEVTVRDGDTAGAIALEHGITVDELVGMQRGKLADPNRLRVGQVLHVVVDGGVVPEFQPAPVAKVVRASRVGSRSRLATGPRPQVGTQLRVDPDAAYIKRPHLAWGTSGSIRAIEQAVAQYRKRHRNAPRVHIGDISRRGGGTLEPHLSHRAGLDVDVGYVLLGSDGQRTRFSGVTRTNLDVARTWSLIRAFIDTGNVEVIFMDYGIQEQLYEYASSKGVSSDELDELFQYPRGRGRSHGIIRHWRSHAHHFHVRFRG